MSRSCLAPTDLIYPTVSQDALHVNNTHRRKIIRDDRWQEAEGKECHFRGCADEVLNVCLSNTHAHTDL